MKRLVALQSRRQQLLDGGTDIHVVADEAVLRRTIGTRSVMVEQLQRLLVVGARPRVRLQVLCLAAPRAVLSGSFTLLSFADSADIDVAYFGGARGQAIQQNHAADVRAAHAGFDHLSDAALSLSESADLISAMLR